jgi:hypothetical protein
LFGFSATFGKILNPPGGVFGLEKPDRKRDQIYVQYLEDCDQKMAAKLYNVKVRVSGGYRA